ncbi:hypothetical protein PHYPSEUDO_008089 [Phytophthora pseudosyringae]|uniref:Uncharacterized protein n=1 Tax=Phytophthora pseudosyringae TaxID=221518 RepID=A0A8T1VFG7_9STRA|nr:hypothetical protein PHYPSEUDO_008089 [Phytophthora pseudosyringae]
MSVLTATVGKPADGEAGAKAGASDVVELSVVSAAADGGTARRGRGHGRERYDGDAGEDGDAGQAHEAGTVVESSGLRSDSRDGAEGRGRSQHRGRGRSSRRGRGRVSRRVANADSQVAETGRDGQVHEVESTPGVIAGRSATSSGEHGAAPGSNTWGGGCGGQVQFPVLMWALLLAGQELTEITKGKATALGEAVVVAVVVDVGLVARMTKVRAWKVEVSVKTSMLPENP